MIRRSNERRLLPWSGPDGEPCYVIGNGTGRVSRMADEAEGVQLGMAAELLGHAADMLADDDEVNPVQLRYLAACMAEALHNVHRIAESRGARLPVPVDDDPNEPDDHPDDPGDPDANPPLLSKT